MKTAVFVTFLGAACVALSSATPIKVNKRDISRPSSKIIGGSLARAGQFPYAAAITVTQTGGKYFCAGTLVSNRYIVTAGQCVDQATLLTMYLGSIHYEGDEGHWYSTYESILHPDYTPTPLMNDIGLIRIRIPITFTDYIKPVNFLASDELLDGTSTLVFGWGQTSDADTSFSDKLEYVFVAPISNQECAQTFGDIITDEKVCLAGNNNEGSCHGDSGGGLIHLGQRAMSYLVGVSSFVSQAGCELHPTGFTRVFPFRDWLDSYIQSTESTDF